MSSDFGNYCNIGAHIAILEMWWDGVGVDEAKKKDQFEEEEGA